VRAAGKLALVVAALAAGAGAVVFSGVLPLGASEGHWPVTRWLLHFTMRRTVAARVIGLEAPPLDDHALAVRGAAHFETGCRPCHGAPEAPPPETLRHMTPRAPFLVEAIGKWSAPELFWVVKHGIKFTGMPGWPDARREDEVWAMVAFLARLPQLDEPAYRRLAFGETLATGRRGTSPLATLTPETATDPPSEVAATCSRCHGSDGAGRDAAFPRLAGQSREYLANSLEAYAAGRRASGTMRPIAARLDREAIQELAAYYAGLPQARAGTAVDPAAAARGANIALRGVPEQRVPACASCHGPKRGPRRAAYPLLAGQPAAYLAQQLRLFHAGKRGGSPYAHLMRHVAPRLSEAQRLDVAAYYASQPGAPTGTLRPPVPPHPAAGEVLKDARFASLARDEP
jgi:cytochrome c553